MMLGNYKKYGFSAAILALMPFVAFAQFTDGNGQIGIFVGQIITFINQTLVPFVFAVSLLVFIYGVYLYFFYGKSEEDARKNGRDYMMWAVAAFVVMVSVWGIVNLIAGGFGFNKTDNIDNLVPNAGDIRS